MRYELDNGYVEILDFGTIDEFRILKDQQKQKYFLEYKNSLTNEWKIIHINSNKSYSTIYFENTQKAGDFLKKLKLEYAREISEPIVVSQLKFDEI